MVFALFVLLFQDGACRGDAARQVAAAVRLGESFDLAGAADGYAAAAKAGCADAGQTAIYVRGLIAGRAADAQFFQPGCPMQYNRPLPPGAK